MAEVAVGEVGVGFGEVGWGKGEGGKGGAGDGGEGRTARNPFWEGELFHGSFGRWCVCDAVGGAWCVVS